MLNYRNAHRLAHPRLLLSVFVVLVLFLTSACGLFGTKKKIQVPQLLTPAADAGRERLIYEVNRLSNVTSIHGKIYIVFEDTSFATSGIADRYRQVDGDITIQRPGKIYLIIQFLLVDIAQMSSDGEQFRVAVLQGDRYKRFVKGTNNAVYKKLDEVDPVTPAKNEKNVEKEAVSALSNLRPQHLTDAFMIRPIDPNGSLVYAQSESFQEEPDMRQGARKGARVMRPYYVLDEFSQPSAGQAKLQRRLWFDRVSGIRLARIQSFDDAGKLVTDVAYFNEKQLGAGPTASLPSRIEITRPQDQYKLSITYQDESSVELNRAGGYAPKAFVLENKWGLPEVDLDAPNKKVTANK